jgi:hypothetical protein
MLATGNEELVGRPTYRDGMLIRRVTDGSVFPIEYGSSDGKKNSIMAFIADGEDSFMVGVGGKLLSGWEVAEQPSGDPVPA